MEFDYITKVDSDTVVIPEEFFRQVPGTKDGSAGPFRQSFGVRRYQNIIGDKSIFFRELLDAG